MAVQRGGTPPVHWSVWLFASIGLAFVLAGALNMVRLLGRSAASRVCLTPLPGLRARGPARRARKRVRISCAVRACCAALGSEAHAWSLNVLPPSRRSWVATGYKQFAADWSKGGVHLLLNHSYIDAAELEPGTVEPRSTRIWLNVSDTAAPLKGRHVNDQAQYSQVQWFNVRGPLACR